MILFWRCQEPLSGRTGRSAPWPEAIRRTSPKGRRRAAAQVRPPLDSTRDDPAQCAGRERRRVPFRPCKESTT